MPRGFAVAVMLLSVLAWAARDGNRLSTRGFVFKGANAAAVVTPCNRHDIITTTTASLLGCVRQSLRPIKALVPHNAAAGKCIESCQAANFTLVFESVGRPTPGDGGPRPCQCAHSLAGLDKLRWRPCHSHLVPSMQQGSTQRQARAQDAGLLRVWAAPAWLNPPPAAQRPWIDTPLHIFSCFNDPSSDVFHHCHMAPYFSRPYFYYALDCTVEHFDEIWAAVRALTSRNNPVMIVSRVLSVNALYLFNSRLMQAAPLPRTAILIQHDEFHEFGVNSTSAGSRHPCLYKNYFDAHQYQILPFLRYFPLGPRLTLAGQALAGTPQRPYVVTFVASPTNPVRRLVCGMEAALSAHFGGPRVKMNLRKTWHTNPSRDGGVEPDEYQKILANSMFGLVVIGHNIDQFRIYECLMHGTIPIFVRNETTNLAPIFLTSPMVFIARWEDLIPEIDMLMRFDDAAWLTSQPGELLRRQRALVTWYHEIMWQATDDLEVNCLARAN